MITYLARSQWGAQRRIVAASLLAFTVLLGGCALLRLRKDVARLEAFGFVGGHVTRAQDDGAPVVVVLSAGSPESVVDWFVLEGSGAYFFTVPAGTYRIAAFADRNRDFVYQPDTEPAAVYGAPSDVYVGAGQRIVDADFALGTRMGTRLGFPVSVNEVGARGHELPAIQLGEVVTLDDRRFSEENAKLGMWQPVEFLFQIGGGFYFLEPFDPKKTPVLFVHGAGGEPGNWRQLIAQLDRKKFQPWLVYYPSGLGLNVTGRGLARWLSVLIARHSVHHLVVVAHSMGGLVARSAINRLIANGDGDLVSLFVSIATPWNGHAAATRGAERAPVVMPMWTDVVPGSPFIQGLFATPLPRSCPFYLIFGFRGGRSFVLDEQNDGVVALSSVLATPAQQAATRIYGFDESHTSILESAAVANTLNAILATAGGSSTLGTILAPALP